MSMIEISHIIFGFSSLAFGLYILLTTKGTKLHKTIGKLYVISMVLLNVTAFCIYDLFGGFGIFHWAAVVSSLTIAGGIGVLVLRNMIKNWLALHYELMVWSYIGLLAATSNEMFVHVPIFKELAKTFSPAPLISMLLVFSIGAWWEIKDKPRLTKRFLSMNK